MKRENLIDDVLLPSDSLVKNEMIFDALGKRGCSQQDISYIRDLICGRDAYDFSGYSGITTIVVPKTTSQEKGYCIKISDNPSELYENFVICNIMAKYYFSSNVIKYISSNKDYLITEQIEAPMVVNEFSDFRSMATFMGSALRKFHNTDWSLESMSREEITILQTRTNNMIKKALAHERGLGFLAQYSA